MVLPGRVPRSLRALLIAALIGLMGPWAATARARPAPPSVEVRDPAWIGKDGRPKPRVRNRARREGRLHEHRLHSAHLDREFKWRVYLPPGGLEPGRGYPLLVLLHGLGGSGFSWLRYAGITARLDRQIERGTMPPCIALIVDAGNGYFTNWTDGKHPYEDLVTRGFLSAVRGRYPVLQHPGAVAIVGVSMGGYGAVSMGLRHPELFGFVAGLSPTDMAIAIEDSPRKKVYRKVFGFPHDLDAVKRHNPFHLVEAGAGEPRRQRYLLLYGGREARKFKEGTQRLEAAMRQRDFDVHVHVEPGGVHGWRTTWDPAHEWWLAGLGAWWRAKPWLTDRDPG